MTFAVMSMSAAESWIRARTSRYPAISCSDRLSGVVCSITVPWMRLRAPSPSIRLDGLGRLDLGDPAHRLEHCRQAVCIESLFALVFTDAVQRLELQCRELQAVEVTWRQGTHEHPSSIAELAHFAFFGSFCINLSHLSNILAHFIVVAL